MKDELQKQQPAFCPYCEEKSVDNSEVSDKLKEMIAKRTDFHEPEARGESIEMPKYKCKKVVWALKIKDIILDSDLARQTERKTDGSAMIIPEEEGYAPFKVDSEYINKHKPQVGGYYVVYKGGYKSFSPASAFEEGYVRYSGSLTFGLAIEAIKDGHYVARKGWNGKGMYIFLIGNNINQPGLGGWTYTNGVNDNVELLPFIAMKTTDNKVVPWLASQTDMLADDWYIVK